MGRAARHKLKPADMLAHAATLSLADQALHVYFETRFDKWKKTCPHAGFDRPTKYRVKNCINEQSSCCKRYVLIDNQSFILKESPFMTGICCLVAINPARINKTKRRLVGLHIANAGAGKMRTQA